MSESPAKEIAVIGLPNTGKSQIYNELTGQYALVANYPLTTVDVSRAKVSVKGSNYKIIDTPGLHSLYIHSEEELVVRDFLYSEKPDGIIQCIDANRLKQSLFLTLDIVELGVPFSIVLNSIEETARNDTRIDVRSLSAALGVEVFDHRSPSSHGNLKSILESVRKSSLQPRYDAPLTEVFRKVEECIPENQPYRIKTAILIADGDPYIETTLGSSLTEVNAIRSQYRGNLSRDLGSERARIVESLFKENTIAASTGQSRVAQEFARITRHPVYGLPILGAILVVAYILVVHVAGWIEGSLSSVLVDPLVERIATAVRSPVLSDFLVGDYGILTLGLFNALVTVLPILSMFFLLMGFVEDVGYLPNVSVLARRVLGKIGLSGRSIMSLVLGFGCKTMATLTTRGITSKRERYITIYLIAFAIPCSAQLAIDMAILGRVGFVAFLIAYATLAIVEIGAGFILNKIMKKEAQSDFIQELPPIRMPSPVAILKKTAYRLYWFLKEAVPIFLVAAVVLFLVDLSGILGSLKSILHPVVTGWLGLPIDMVEILIISLARHEAAAGMLLRMVDSGALDYIQVIVAVVITTMFVPCFTNIVAMCRQIGVSKGLLMTVTINLSSFVLAGILHWLLVFAMR